MVCHPPRRFNKEWDVNEKIQSKYKLYTDWKNPLELGLCVGSSKCDPVRKNEAGVNVTALEREIDTTFVGCRNLRLPL